VVKTIYIFFISLFVCKQTLSQQSSYGLGGGTGGLVGTVMYVEYDRDFKTKYDSTDDIEDISKFTMLYSLIYEYGNYNTINYKNFGLNTMLKTRIASYPRKIQATKGLYLNVKTGLFIGSNFDNNIFSNGKVNKYELGLMAGPEIEWKYFKGLSINISYLQSYSIIESSGRYNYIISTGVNFKL
jgi:hypothetical protein